MDAWPRLVLFVLGRASLTIRSKKTRSRSPIVNVYSWEYDNIYFLLIRYANEAKGQHIGYIMQNDTFASFVRQTSENCNNSF